MNYKNVHIVINPASAGGRTGERRYKILNEAEKYFGKNYSLWITKNPLDAEHYAHYIIDNDSDLIIVIGGDGTVQESVNGMLAAANYETSSCKLGIISSGTGQGFAQSLSLPSSIKDQIEIINNGVSKKIDVGKISFYQDGRACFRFFVNEFQIGIGGAVVRNVNKDQKRAGGLLAFGLGTLTTAMKYPNQKLSLIINNGSKIIDEFTGVVVANGGYTGGGMNLTPLSNLNDGFLDLLLIKKQSKLQRLISFSKIYSGRHINSPLFDYGFVKQIKIESDKEVPVEADGEIWGTLPCEVEVVHSAISVCVPKSEGEKNEKLSKKNFEVRI